MDFMTSAKEYGKMQIQTVLGPISTEKLGRTSVHEHITCGAPLFFKSFGEKWMRNDTIVERGVAQLTAANQLYGLKTIVDGSPFALGRDVKLLQKISLASGVNIIASTGLFTGSDGLYEASVEIQAEYFIDECENGIEGTGIKPGFLKCGTDPLSDLRSVEIMARVQKQTGLPLFAHSDSKAKTGLKQLAIFEEAGLNLEKIVIGHVGDAHDVSYPAELLQHGGYVSIDRLYQGDDIAAKAEIIAELAAKGWLKRIVLGHDDICCKQNGNLRQLAQTGGGIIPESVFSNIGDMLIPELKKRGFSDADIRILLESNPARLFDGC